MTDGAAAATTGMVDARARFSATVDDYARYRPGYPDALVDWVLASAGLAERSGRVVDLGCGTGIASRAFAARGHAVVGVDPNEDMLAAARAVAGDRVDYRRGEAAATGLPDGYEADLVIAAQAFHWFDVPATLREIARVAKPDGRAAAFWNLRRPSPFATAYEALLGGIDEYRARPRPEDAMAAIERAVGHDNRLSFTCANDQRLDRAGLLGRARSSSYVAHGLADDAARATFAAALDALFDAHAVDGVVTLPYVVTARVWPAAAGAR